MVDAMTRYENAMIAHELAAEAVDAKFDGDIDAKIIAARILSHLFEQPNYEWLCRRDLGSYGHALRKNVFRHIKQTLEEITTADDLPSGSFELLSDAESLIMRPAVISVIR